MKFHINIKMDEKMIDGNVVDDEIMNSESKEMLIEKLCTTMIDDLINFINNDNYPRVAQFMYMLEQINDKDTNEHLGKEQKEIFQKLIPMIDNKKLNIEMEKSLKKWTKSLAVNSIIDYWSPNEKAYFSAKLQEKHDSSKYLVHFLGWDVKHDLILDLASCICAPYGTFVKVRGEKKAIKEDTTTNASSSSSSSSTITTTTITSTTTTTNTTAIATSTTKTSNNENNDDNNLGRRRSVKSYVQEVTVKSTKKTREEDGEPDSNDWVCSVCSFLESDDGSSLILCDGPCKRSFHLGCLDKKQKITEGDWYCNECKLGKHECFVCKETGDDWTQVAKCSTANCGKYYHKECLTSLEDVNPTCLELKECNKKVAFPVLKYSTIEPTVDNSGTPKNKKPQKPKIVESVTFEQKEVDTFTFKCPLHVCNTCYNEYGRKRKGGNDEIFCCLLCPTGYHINCIAPGSRFNSMCLLCPYHPDVPLPSKDLTKKDSDLSGNTIWAQIVLPDAYPDVNKIDDGGHFRLPIQYKDDITAEVKQWTQIKNLDYSLLPNREKSLPVHYSEECCECVDVCGETCLNRILKIECCDPSANNGIQICNVGPKCTNRRLQNQEYALTEKFREHAMGWGLRSLEFIKSGSLVIEYIGEVIDEVEMVRRMDYQRKYAPADHDFYVMELDAGIYVDGKKKGSPSRFINHSCDPNCELERTVVKGRMRIAIVAIKDIAPGEPLSYDYQFDTQDSEAFKCYCGNDICRGTMAPKKRNDMDKNTMTNRERQRLVQLGRQILKKTEANEGGIARNYTSKFLPGDNILEISSGPQKSTFSHARSSQLFLPRNIKKTTNFHKRRHWMWLSREELKKDSSRKSSRSS